MERSIPTTAPTAEKPPLSEAERAEWLHSHDGLNHDTLAQVDPLTADAW